MLDLICWAQGYSSGAWSSRGDFSCCRGMDLGHVGSVVVMLGLSCPAIYDVFLDQGANCVPWEVDS